jgi:hypothetical protein
MAAEGGRKRFRRWLGGTIGGWRLRIVDPLEFHLVSLRAEGQRVLVGDISAQDVFVEVIAAVGGDQDRVAGDRLAGSGGHH